MRIKTGIFGGSFNPIHIGHLALANYLCEFEELDEIWFMITPQNPLKKEMVLLDDYKRLKLVKLAIEGYPRFMASDVEFQLPKPSYTIHTVDTLKNAFPDREFYLLIGADNWVHFKKWKDYQRILKENNILVYPRTGFDVNVKNMPTNVRYVKAPVFDISSTLIREAIKAGKDVRFFLQSSVYQEIKRCKYYFY